jgi:hypothetical protein
MESRLRFGSRLLRIFSVWRQTHPVTHWIEFIIPYPIPFVNRKAELMMLGEGVEVKNKLRAKLSSLEICGKLRLYHNSGRCRPSGDIVA